MSLVASDLCSSRQDTIVRAIEKKAEDETNRTIIPGIKARKRNHIANDNTDIAYEEAAPKRKCHPIFACYVFSSSTCHLHQDCRYKNTTFTGNNAWKCGLDFMQHCTEEKVCAHIMYRDDRGSKILQPRTVSHFARSRTLNCRSVESLVFILPLVEYCPSFAIPNGRLYAALFTQL